MSVKTSDFDYVLPPELIAQTPLVNRSDSRLLLVHPGDHEFKEFVFSDLTELLNPGDVLVRNNTRVLPARLFGIKEETGAKVEVLLLKAIPEGWQALCGNARVIKEGTWITFGNGELKAQCIRVGEAGIRDFSLVHEGDFFSVLDQLGQMPLPPYIHKKLSENQRYNTVYAKMAGSAAAPTAGLHFTPQLFEQLKAKGIEVVDLTLHVGLGTFRPLKSEEILDHHMHSEWYSLSEQSSLMLQKAKEEGRRIIAIGTTSCRTLETIWRRHGCFLPECGESDLFLYPGNPPQSIDGLITNFHLPKSTLILLVSALASRETILNAYQYAIEHKFRFYSFGDAMLIL